jgi:hypothetical protein
MRKALETIELGPLDDREMEEMKSIGDHVYTHTSRFF